MKTIPLITGLLFALLSAGAFAANQNADWARGLDFERATEAADLIVVVKVEEVEQIRFMRGGKGESSVAQYKLKPLKVLKGVFAREELSLMSSDLGGYRFGNQMKQIQPGAILLLFLGRSEVGYENANSNVNSWQQSMPVLRNENDPLTDAVKALLALQAEHQESKRVKILLDRLAVAEDIDAIPLFAALDRLAWAAAQNPDTAKIVDKLIASPNPLVSTAAADSASHVLAQDYLRNEAMEKELETALLAAFGLFYGKISKLDEKLLLPPETVMLIREQVARLNVCLFCMDIGRAFSIKASMNESKCDALEQYRTSAIFTDAERAALDYVTELTKEKKVNPDTFARISHYYSEREICEIVWLVASEHVYNMTNLGLNIHSDMLCAISRKKTIRSNTPH